MNTIAKRLIFSLVLCNFFAMLFAQNNESIRDITVKTLDDTFVYRYYFNLSNQLVEEHQFIMNGNDEVDYAKMVWDYSEDLLTRQAEYLFVNNEWQLSQEQLLDYEGNTLVTRTNKDYNTGTEEKFHYSYTNGFLSALSCDINGVNSYQYAYHYNQSQLESMEISLGAENYMKVLYSWRSKSLLDEIIVQMNDHDNWTNHIRYVFFYNDTDNAPIMQKMMIWKKTPKGMGWVNLQSSAYQYDGSKMIEEVNNNWAGMSWEDKSRIAYEYSGSLLTHKDFDFPIYRKWRTASHVDYSYLTNPTREQTVSIYDFWGGDEGSGCMTMLPLSFTSQNDIRTKIGTEVTASYGQQIITSYVSPIYGTTVNILPNPSNGKYIISSSADILGWKVYGLDGNLIDEQSGAQLNIDITSAPTGVYILHLTTSNGILYHKLIKL